MLAAVAVTPGLGLGVARGFAAGLAIAVGLSFAVDSTFGAGLAFAVVSDVATSLRVDLHCRSRARWFGQAAVAERVLACSRSGGCAASARSSSPRKGSTRSVLIEGCQRPAAVVDAS